MPICPFSTGKYVETSVFYVKTKKSAVERLFSLGKDVLKPERSGLTDQHFEMSVFFKGSL